MARPLPSGFPNLIQAQSRGLAFVWLDEIMTVAEPHLSEVIQPFQWSFYRTLSRCVPYMQYQSLGGNEVFLVVSGSLGYELFTEAYQKISRVQYVYVYCSQLGLHERWIRYYSKIRGVYNDSQALAKAIQSDLDNVRQAQLLSNTDSQVISTMNYTGEVRAVMSLPNTSALRNTEESNKAHSSRERG